MGASLGPAHVHLETTLGWRSRGGVPLFETAALLPGGYNVRKVSGSRLRTWWIDKLQDGRQRLLCVFGPGASQQAVRVFARRDFASTAVSLDLPVVTIELPSAGIMPTIEKQRTIWRDLVSYLGQNIPRQQGIRASAVATGGSS